MNDPGTIADTTTGDAPRPGSLAPARPQWSLLVNMADLVNKLHHSDDFIGSRAEYITDRVRALGLLFAVLIQLWIPLDWFLVDGESFVQLTVVRLFTTLAFLALARWRPRGGHDLRLAHLQLALLVVIPCVFYFISRQILESGATSWALMGYGFYPLVIAATLAIFPLTLIEGLLLVLPVFGTVLATEYTLDTLYTAETVGVLWLLALLTSLALWAEMSQLQMLLRLYRQATRDPLTGLFNRRALMLRLEEEIERAQRYRRPLTVLLFDLDKFKRINDTHGHLTGDAVLRHFAGLVEQALRRSDLVGRYGGEEFLGLLPETPAATAQEVAERIRLDCHGNPALGPGDQRIEFTTSIGVAELREGEQGEQVLTRVDESLYAAKEGGRDRVILST